MNNMMPDPISSMGRAVQAKTNNMAPNQVAQLDQQYAQMGLTSLNDVITLKQQLDRLKQAQQGGQPPQTTVAQDLQQQMTQMGGLVGLPSNVGNAQAYARGGIVSFYGGGGVPDPLEAQRALLERAASQTPQSAEQLGSAAERIRQAEKAAEAAAKKAVKEKGFLTKSRSLKGLGGLRGVVGGSIVPLALTQSIVNSARGIVDPIPIENIRDYYAEKGLLPESHRKPGGVRTTPLGQTLDDAYWRGVAGLQNLVTLGFTGPKRDPKTPEVPAEDVPVDLTGIDLSLKDGMEGGSGLMGLAARGLSPGLAGSAMDDVINTAKQRVGTAPDERTEIEKQMQLMREYGIGQSAEQDRARYAKDLEKIPEDQRRDKWLAAAKAFGAMGMAAGEDGATFGGAASTGVAVGADAYEKVLDKYRNVEDKIRDKLSEVSRYEEVLKSGGIQRGSARYDSLSAKHDAALNHVETLQAKKAELEIQIALENMKQQTDIMVANASRVGKGAEAEGLRQAFIRASLEGTPEGRKKAQYYYDILTKLAELAPTVQARQEANTPYIIGGTQGTVGGPSMEIVNVRPDTPTGR